MKEQGLDSLMALELRSALTRLTGTALPATLAFDYPRRAELFRGELDRESLMTSETKDYGSVWGQQHIEVLRNFAAAVQGIAV